MDDLYTKKAIESAAELLNIKTSKIQNIITLNSNECIVYLKNGKSYTYNINKNSLTEIVVPKEKFSLKDFDFGLFLWDLIPLTPALATFAFMFLAVTNIWFWVCVVAAIIPIIIIRPGINSCSQYHNVYIMSICCSLGVLIVRLLGFLPVV
jgi:hypothetical protein